MGIVVRGGMAAEGMGGMAMGGMSAAGWSLGGAVVFVAVWTVMMAAMMLPAAAPMIVIFASAQARRARDVGRPDLDLRRRLHPGLAGGRPPRLCPGPDRQRDRHRACLGRPGELGADRPRDHPGRSGPLSVHADQTRLPDPLPLALCLRGTALARRTCRRAPDGPPARWLLSWLLLGAVRRDGCRRRDEPGLDAPAHAGCLRRESAPAGPARLTHDRCRPDRSRADGRKWRRLDAVDRLINAFWRSAPASAEASCRRGHGGRQPQNRGPGHACLKRKLPQPIGIAPLRGVGDQLVEQKGTMDERDARWTARAKFVLHRSAQGSALPPPHHSPGIRNFRRLPISRSASWRRR